MPQSGKLPVLNLLTGQKQETQHIAEKPRDAFSGQSRSLNMLPFHMLGIVSY